MTIQINGKTLSGEEAKAYMRAWERVKEDLESIQVSMDDASDERPVQWQEPEPKEINFNI